MNLTQCMQGETVRVLKVGGEADIRQRFTGLGILRGAVVKIIRYAPLKDPVEIMVKGTRLSLRVQDVEFIEVEKVQT
ncbi:MAG: FeoA domain-containing protein [Fibrobacteres bacterium]|nr:FeoA domain-containing protein [Fibrobacterota bacterium]